MKLMPMSLMHPAISLSGCIYHVSISFAVRDSEDGMAYQCHECIAIVFFSAPALYRWLRAPCHTHAPVVCHVVIFASERSLLCLYDRCRKVTQVEVADMKRDFEGGK